MCLWENGKEGVKSWFWEMEKGDGLLGLSKGRGERKRGLFLGRGDSRAKKRS